MRWLTFALLGAIAVCFQTTLSTHLAFYGIRPDFVFIIVVHYALHARGSDGPIAGWLLGLMMGLTSAEAIGTVSLVYCLMAAVLWSLRDLMFTRHPLTHFTLTLVFCFVAQLLLRGHFMLTTARGVGDGIFMPSLLAGAYTGAWAVPIHLILLRCSRALGLPGREDPTGKRAMHAL